MSFLSRNVELSTSLKVSSWRKTAIGSWGNPSDPSIYGIIELDVTPALNYISRLSQLNGQKITLSHFIGKATAEVCRRHPSINQILRFGRLHQRKTIDICFLVARDFDGDDLTALTIRDAEKKTVSEIAKEMTAGVKSIREGTDHSFDRAKKSIGSIPSFLSRQAINFLGFFLYKLNLWTPLLGFPKNPFGSAIITNVGTLGLETAFAPLVPYTHVPIMLTIGAAHDAPVVQNGKVTVGKIMKLHATIDHRVIDGVHASKMALDMKKMFADPTTEFGPIEKTSFNLNPEQEARI